MDDSARSGVAPSFTGWRMTVALSGAIVVAYGVTYYAFGPLLPSMQAAFHASRAVISGAYSLGAVIGGLAGVAVGRYLDRHAVRPVMLFGSALATVGLLLVALSPSVVLLYAAWGCIIGPATAMTYYDPVFLLISRWFVRQRGRAMGVLTFGGGFSSIIFIPLISLLNAQIGWRLTWVVLAVIMLTVTTPIYILFAHSRPEDLGQFPDGESPRKLTTPALGKHGRSVDSALRSRPFLCLTAAFFAGNLAVYAIVVHLVPILLWAGQSPSAAAVSAALLGVSALPGRLLLNSLGDVLPRPLILGSLLALMGAAVCTLSLLHRGGFLYGFVIVYGLGNGCFSPLKATIMADYFAGAHFGSILSLQSALLTVATASGPSLVGSLYDRSGGYRSGLVVIGVCLLLAATLVSLSPQLAGEPSVIDPQGAESG